jgi:Peptidase propeptide and YPEB domain
MRTSVKLGAGLTSAAIVASLAAGVAAATVSGPQRAATASLAAATSSAHITKQQARHLARAAVPHSRVIEIESDDVHDRAVWKVKLATPHGRVVVAVDKKTGKVTILRGHGGGHDDVLLSTRSAMLVLAGEHRGFEPGDDRGIEQEPGDDRGVDQHADDNGVDQRGDDQGQAGQNRGPGNGGQDDGPGHDSGHGGSGHDG